ncbi:3-dehydroquinate synthase [Leptolyngbya sp. FACHB-261]|uniref:3-dehydroquinate synthase n=1 Tax=Leptolyngbya sp. FACHB-261 TaxID=2692806 RepID=UPI001681F2A1|nr:3-dehydroquinate synthase [Leptolyngbya sp. FACHB-261]MBD2104267.1 3-dehydroquinate synthase [Leptolyngbya sp. FACHB-261]
MSSTVVSVELPRNPYSVVIEPGGLGNLAQHLQTCGQKAGSRVLLVSNPAIFKRYGQQVVEGLAQAGYDTATCLLPPGERYKTLASVQKIYDAALSHHLERSSLIVALGGGVIGDMAGFAAATWLRGIAVVQVPTSLLAMVDASIGGKTGVNHPQGKNLIGAFHQPRLVLIDPDVLSTLPPREFRAGMAEVIKYGIIWDIDLFAQLEASPRLDSVRALTPELLYTILEHSARAKAEVVAKDEKESNLRAILNYGHTVGHAIESLTHYRHYNHGEAVGLGMMAAGSIAAHLGLWDRSDADRQNALIARSGLPTTLLDSVEAQAVLSSLQSDKKVQDGRVRFVLPRTIGTVIVTDQVPGQSVLEAVQQLQA